MVIEKRALFSLILQVCVCWITVQCCLAMMLFCQIAFMLLRMLLQMLLLVSGCETMVVIDCLVEDREDRFVRLLLVRKICGIVVVEVVPDGG